MIFVGIDPGKTGAIAVLDGDSVEVHDCPLGSDGKVSLQEMGALIRSIAIRGDVWATIEKVNSRPNDGHVGAFSFGENYGLWQGLLAGMGIDVHYVAPAEWMKVMIPPSPRQFPRGRLVVLKQGGKKRDKQESLDAARKMFPTADLHLKGHHGRAEALLIADYGRRAYRFHENSCRWSALHG